MTKKTLVLISVTVGIVGITVGVFGFYLYDVFLSLKKSTTSILSEKEKNAGRDFSLTQTETLPLEKENQMPLQSDWASLKKQIDETYPGAEHIERGWVTWHDPVDLGDLGWTEKTMYSGFYGMKSMKDLSTKEVSDFMSNGIKYIEVGTVTQGKYAHSKVVIFFSLAGNPEPRTTASKYYALIGSLGNTILLGMENEDSREYRKSELLSYVKNIQFDENAIIDELVIYPKEIRGRTDREILQREEYAGNFFLSTEKLTRLFSDSILGQVWMGEAEKKYPETPQDLLVHTLNSFVSFDEKGKMTSREFNDVSANGFYLRRPDGTAVVYRQKLDIFDVFDRVGVLQATWNDGIKNTDQYEEYPSGCGMTSYMYDVTDTVSIERDTVAVGKTEQGDVLYGYKDTTHPEFKKLYNEIYWVEEGRKKVSPEEFLKEYPEVFWRNSFGRTLAFYNTKFISPAECGKPVIYLYPQEKTDVSVRVFPSAFTKTDPEYGNGWNVSADTNGTLTNVTDGKEYPYLFWEGYSDVLYEKSDRGFVVAQDGLEKFLDEKLSQLGLVGKEISDFKEFWLPKMQGENKPFYFVTFLPKSQIDALAPLKISPKPDTVIRVMMDYRGLDTWENVFGYALSAPERKGFTAVEWGGMLRK